MSKTTDRVIGIAEAQALAIKSDDKIYLQNTIKIYRAGEVSKNTSTDKLYDYTEILGFLKTLTIEELKNIFIDMKSNYSNDDIAMLKGIITTAWQVMMEDSDKVYVLKVIKVKVDKKIHFIKEVRNIGDFSLKKALDIANNIEPLTPFVFHVSEIHSEIIKSYESIKDFAECIIVQEYKNVILPYDESKKEKTFMEELDEMPVE